MALTQNVPATRPQSPLTRVAGGIAKAAHAHRGNQAPRPPAVDPLLTPTGPSRASCHTGAETATWAEEQNSMPSEQHEQWKRDLFNHLERKLNGCIGCGIGEDPKDHLPVHKGHQYDPSQQIIWTCEQMHPHRYDLLRGAGSVAMEKYQSAPNSGRCCPDLTVLNTHREPMAFIEIVRSSRPRNAVKVASDQRQLVLPVATTIFASCGNHSVQEVPDWLRTIALLRQRQMEGKKQQTAAAMAGMSERSARKWQCGPLPSETKQRRWRTRPDPFDGVWEEEILPLLRGEAAGRLRATTIIEWLEGFPGRFKLRTLQRHRTGGHSTVRITTSPRASTWPGGAARLHPLQLPGSNHRRPAYRQTCCSSWC